MNPTIELFLLGQAPCAECSIGRRDAGPLGRARVLRDQSGWMLQRGL